MALFNTLVKKRTIANSEQYNNTNHHHHHDTELGNDHQQLLMSSHEDNKNIHHHHHTSLSASTTTIHKPLSYVDSYSSSIQQHHHQQQSDMKPLNSSSFDFGIPTSQSVSTSLHSRSGSNNTNTSMNSSTTNNNNITNRKHVHRHTSNNTNQRNNNNHKSVSASSSSSFLDDCESGISMNCKCRKATLMITFGIAIIITFYSNISLVIKLGSQQYYNTNTGIVGNSVGGNHPYLFDETYHHLQQMIHSYPVGDKNINNMQNNIANRRSKAEKDTDKIEEMVGDDDDPLEDEQQQDEDEEDNNNNNDDEEANSHNGDSNGDDSIDMSSSDIASTNSNISSSLLSLSSGQKSNTMKRSRPRNRSKNNMGRLVKNNNYKIKKIRQQQQQKNRNHNNLGRNSNRKHPIVKNNARANIMDIEPTVQAMSVNASFSACLLIKDDNDILNEWIAYHYHTIKLRHLIVAIDPLSSQSPTALLAKWKLMTDLNIRIWYDKHYMPTEFVQTNMAPSEFIATETDLKNSKMRTESIIEISNHRYRQRIFLASCLRSMRAEGNSWVIHIDTDEYVVPSKLLRQMKPRYVVIPPIEEPGSVLSLIQQVVEKTGRNVNYPCISMLRVLFGSVESSIEEQSVGVPSPYNATAFESLRWRYHALPHSAELHGNPKVILDVQAIPEKYFDETIVFSIHRPVRQYCPKNSDLAFSNFRKQPIAVNHYLGSWERYSGRNDKRRSRDKYDMKASVNRGHDDGLRLWLHGFVETMGAENASILLGEQYLLHYYENDSNNTSSLEDIQLVSTLQTKQSNSILQLEPIPLQKHLLDTDTIAQ